MSAASANDQKTDANRSPVWQTEPACRAPRAKGNAAGSSGRSAWLFVMDRVRTSCPNRVFHHGAPASRGLNTEMRPDARSRPGPGASFWRNDVSVALYPGWIPALPASRASGVTAKQPGCQTDRQAGAPAIARSSVLAPHSAAHSASAVIALPLPRSGRRRAGKPVSSGADRNRNMPNDRWCATSSKVPSGAL